MDLRALIELFFQGLMTVGMTLVFCLLSRFTPLNKLPSTLKEIDKADKEQRILYWVKQISVGICFGVLAIVCNLWGIRYEDAIANTRDANPLVAGLLFGGPAGVIAGLMGGIQRCFMGGFTVVACSVSTCIAGIAAALLREKLFSGHKPNVSVSLATAVVMEILHMSLVIVTRLDSLNRAAHILYVLTFPVVIFTSVSVFLSALIAFAFDHRKGRIRSRKKHISKILQGALIVLVVVAFVVTSAALYFTQTNIYVQAAHDELKRAVNDVHEIYVDTAESYNFSDDDALRYYKLLARKRRVGNGGSVCVADRFGRVVSEGVDAEYISSFLETGVDTNFIVPEGVFTARVNGEDCYMVIRDYDNAYVFAYYTKTAAMYNRNITLYINTYLEVLVFAALFVMVFIVIKKNIGDNVTEVNDSLRDISSGKLDTVVNVRNNVEFDELSDRINTTVDTMKGYIEAESKRIEQDLSMASQIQSSVLPNVFPAFPSHPEFDIYASMDPAKEVGGDFYDFYTSDKNHICFLVADVSGKGIPAAMFMMRAKALLKSLAVSKQSVGEVFTDANNSLCEGNDSGMFVTSLMFKLNFDNGTAEFANAGHNPPLVRRKDGQFEYLKVKAGLVLAGLEGIPYKTQEFVFNPGDTVFIYTDGVTEATNAENELYGEERLKNVLNSCAYSDMRELCERVREDVDRFVGEAPQFDDITMLAFEFKGFKKATFESENCDVSDITEITAMAEKMAEELEMPLKEATKVYVSIDELYSNIVFYAYPDGGPKPARVDIEELRGGHGMMLTFTDEGIPYNPVKKEDPNVHESAENRKIGGLGIYMVKQMMDEMEYEYKNGKNILKIYKKF